MVNRQEIMGCESVDMVRFDLGTLLQGQMRIAKIESAYNSLIIGDRDRKSLARNLLVWSDLTFGPLLQGQMRTAKLKSAYNSLCPPPWGVDILFLLFPPSDVRRPMSGVTHGFRSFKGKVLELLSPNLVCRLIGSVACLGLLLAVVPLLLTE